LDGRGVLNDQNDEETILLKVQDTPPCPRCDGTTLLLAQFQNSWKNRRGEDVPGLKEAVLCPGCDHGEPAAAELLALFAVDDQVSPENMDVFGGLVAAWVESVRQRTVDEEALSAEFELWKRDEL
jgi:thiol-disulfide isomerase/thioredoxin